MQAKPTTSTHGCTYPLYSLMGNPDWKSLTRSFRIRTGTKVRRAEMT